MTYRPSRYRPPRRFRSPYGGGGAGPKLAVAAAAVALAAGAHAHSAAGHPAGAMTARVTASGGALQAIAYARAQLGKPYLWGGTGPDAFDCSGLVMRAWASAGASIARTSEEQWATLPHVSSPQPGDLVFFPGSDGTFSAPGHVAIVVSATTMIQAYATGTPIEVSPLNGDGAGGIVGFARPGGA